MKLRLRLFRSGENAFFYSFRKTIYFLTVWNGIFFALTFCEKKQLTGELLPAKKIRLFRHFRVEKFRKVKQLVRNYVKNICYYWLRFPAKNIVKFVDFFSFLRKSDENKQLTDWSCFCNLRGKIDVWKCISWNILRKFWYIFLAFHENKQMTGLWKLVGFSLHFFNIFV